MKYLPLVWTALWRKPAEAGLTWLAVAASFTLFGLMVGLRATYDQVIENSRMDRLDVNARFPSASPSGNLLPIALRERIARVDGVSSVGIYYWLWGYYQEPSKPARIISVDENMRSAWSELPITSTQWASLFATRSGVLVSRAPAARLGLHVGDTFPLITPPGTRRDGASSWEFRVLDVVPDDPRTGSYILGNFSYIDQARIDQEQGYAIGFRVAARDAEQANVVSLRIDQELANSSTPTITIPDRANEVNAANSSVSVSSRTLPVAGAGIFMILLLIGNGVAQSVRERTPEFAVLRTLGYQPIALVLLVFAEVAIPCLAGALVGTALAAVLTLLPGHYLPEDLASMPKPVFSWMVLVQVVGSAMLLALASAAIPMRRVHRLSIADALAGR